MLRAVDLFSLMGRFAIAAKHLQTVSETYEKDIVDLEKAIETLERVCSLHSTPMMHLQTMLHCGSHIAYSFLLSLGRIS